MAWLGRDARLMVRIVVCVMLALVGVGAWMLTDHPGSAIESARTWARLAPLPASAGQLDVRIRGNMFARIITITFEAPQADIDQWLQSSPGIRDAERTLLANGVERYVIKPFEAVEAEVLVDTRAHAVS